MQTSDDLARRIFECEAPIAIDLDGTLRPFSMNNGQTRQRVDLTADAREFLRRLRKFIVVTGNMTAEAWELLMQMKSEFGDAMLEPITPFAAVRTIIAWKKPIIYCVTDKEDRAFVRTILTLSTQHEGSQEMSDANIRFSCDPIGRADYIFITSYRWLSRREMRSLCATITASTKQGERLPIFTASADGDYYTSRVGEETLRVPGTNCAVKALLEQFPSLSRIQIGKPFVCDSRLSQCAFLIGDSCTSDMLQPIARDGVHILVKARDADGSRFIRRIAKDGHANIVGADYEISDIGALLLPRL